MSKTTDTMTREEYEAFLKVPVGKRDLGDCYRADRLIRATTLAELEGRLKAYSMPKVLKDWIELMARCNFGSGETNDLLMKLNCYPEWLQLKRD